MRLLVGVTCVLASLSGIKATTPDDVYLEFSNLFTSQASNSFPTSKEYVESHKLYEARVADVKNKLADRAHSFVVQLSESCSAECHSALLKKFSSRKYHIYGKGHGTIYGSLDEIREFQASNPGLIKHFAPVHPDMKIDAKLRDISSLALGCYPTPLKTKTLTSPSSDIQIKAPVHRVRVNIMPQNSPEEVKEFLAFTEDLRKQHKNQFTFEFEKKQKHTKGMVGFIVTSRCDKVTAFATAFAQRREVQWMEVDLPVYVHNRWSRGICDTGNADNTPLTVEGLLGDGEIVGVSDTGIDLTNCYFYDSNFNSTFPFLYQYDTDSMVLNDHRKVIQYVAYRDNRDDTESHGTHVCGSVGGFADKNYGDFAKYNGMAYNAKLAFFDIGYANGEGQVSPPANLDDDLLSVMYEAGARIFSNSWGNGNNNYDSLARYVDQFMWDNKDACVMFSAGNTGYLGSNSAGSPSINKNGICVGASLNNYDSWRANTQDTGASDKHDIFSVAYFSSQGPTADGRMKPDILAPGWYVQSAAGIANSSSYHCTIKGLSGTSMATPTAAGFAAKVRQYYREGYYPSGRASHADAFIPSGALIKATLIHSGQQMTYIMRNTTVAVEVGDYPNNIQGFGRIEMNKVLNFGTSSTNPLTMFVVGAVNSSYGSSLYAEITSVSSSKVYTFHTDSSSNQAAIRITLCYVDYPAGNGASTAMVNLLTMSVSDGHGHTYTPTYANDAVQSTAQVIDIDASAVVASSTYTLIVSATSLSQTQPFALVVTGAITYLNDSYATTYTAPTHSATYISSGATIDIILLAVGVFILCSMVYFFSRLTKRSRNLEYDPYAVSSPQQQAGIMGTVQRMRMAAIEKQRLNNASHPAAPAKKGGKKKQAGGGPKNKPQSPIRSQPQQDYVYNPRDFE